MGIRAAYMVPHPPLIVPEVGRGGEKEIAGTSEAYERVARDIAAIAPDTIVITSPHSVMYADYFHISPGKNAKGDLGRFRAPGVRFDEEYDTGFVAVLEKLLSEDSFPGGTAGEKEKALDHGTMVPLYFIRKYYSGGKIVRIGLSGLSLADHYKLGTYIGKTAEITQKSTVIVASGDLSHKLKDYGPYGFDPAGPVYDERIMEAASKADFGGMLEFEDELLDRAAECGHRSFVIMAGALDGTGVRSTVLSHQDITGVGYGICIFEPGEKDSSRCFLDVMAQKIRSDNSKAPAYVRLARASAVEYIKYGKRLKVPEDIAYGLPDEAYGMRAGVFVSVHKSGSLRGCIGTISPVQKCIAEEIISNAISAVSRDPRFDRVREDELDLLEISVDVLGKPEDIKGKEQLDVKKYGVIVSCGFKRGLLLPDLEGVDTVEDQIRIAMQKGGISPEDDYTLQRFEVIRYR